MTKNTRRADTGKPGNKGKFDGKANSVPETGLPAEPQPLVIPIINSVELKQALYPDLPDWPGALPEPAVHFELDAGRVETTITSGAVDFKVWSSEDGHYNSLRYDDGLEKKATGWSEEDEEAAVEWANAVHDRIDGMTYSATLAAVQGEVQRAITAQATGKTYTPAIAPLFTSEELAESAPNRGVNRAEEALSRWFMTPGHTEDTGDVVLQDALSDLMHWADDQGIDFNETIRRAAFIHSDEIRSPEG